MRPEIFPTPTYPEVKKIPYLKEYPKDFGNEAAEKMAVEFFSSMPLCKEVKRASEYDDKKSGFDLILTLENGSKIAVDITSSENIKRQRKKILKIIKNPFVIEHNNKGEVVDKTKMPLILFVYDKKEWGNSYNSFLNKDTKNPLEKININKNIERFLFCAIQCLEHEKYYNPLYEEIYDPPLKILTKYYNLYLH